MYDLLLKLGLSEKEASVYLATLELGRDSVQNIAKKAGIKRVTAYVILDQLVKLGVIRLETEKNKSFYKGEHPSVLEKLIDNRLNDLEEQRANLKSSMDQLEAIYNFRDDKPVVRFFEGPDGLEELDRYGHDQMQPGSVMMTITPHDLIQQAFPKRRKDAVDDRITRGILSRAIYVAEKEIPVSQNIQELRDGIHFSRKELPLNGTFFIYPGWGVKFFNYGNKKYFGVLIQSVELADSMKEVFELAWDGAKMRKVTGKRGF